MFIFTTPTDLISARPRHTLRCCGLYLELVERKRDVTRRAPQTSSRGKISDIAVRVSGASRYRRGHKRHPSHSGAYNPARRGGSALSEHITRRYDLQLANLINHCETRELIRARDNASSFLVHVHLGERESDELSRYNAKVMQLDVEDTVDDQL